MKSVLRLLVLAACTVCCISCGSGREGKDRSADDEPISMLQEFNSELKVKSKISKDEFTFLVKSYKELEDSLAIMFVRDSTMSDVHKFTLLSVTQSQVVGRLCEMADSCDWTFEDIPCFQQTIYSYSRDNRSDMFYSQAVDFYKHLKPGSYAFRSWEILINDYNNFLSDWSNAEVADLAGFHRFLTEENELFTALVSNCVNAGPTDFSAIIDGTNDVCQQLIKSLTESGTPSVQVMTLMYVRSNHRLIQNAVCGLSILSGSDNLTAEHSDLCISLLLSPFICVNRQLVCARTAEQVAEIKQIGRSIPIVLEKCCSNSGFKGIYFNDMPLSIIKKIITDDID